jgi:predicted nucleotide-binding protein (sugar kinase/HSP70/actin superfamily)
MFRALLIHPQETLHKRNFVHCVRVTSIGCGTDAVSLQPCHSQLTLYAGNILNTVCAVPPEDEQVMLETCRGP